MEMFSESQREKGKKLLALPAVVLEVSAASKHEKEKNDVMALIFTKAVNIG